MASPPFTRAYITSRFCLEVAGELAGWLLTAEGGDASTEVVSERLAGGYPVRKHPSIVKFEDLTIGAGTGMSKQFYKWLKTSLLYDHKRHDGAVITANYDFKEVTRLNFRNGLITEVGFPMLDATSKEPCKITVKIAPEETDLVFGGGSRSLLPGNTSSAIQKRWLTSNFRLSIDGMKCKQVNKVEALTIKQKVIENTVGERLFFDKEPVQVDFPNLIITLPEVDAEPWYNWHRDFVIRGNSTQDKEKGGTLEYLTPDLKTVLFTLTFKNLGIIKFTPDKLDSSSEKLRMVRVEMYAETIEFDYGQNSTWA